MKKCVSTLLLLALFLSPCHAEREKEVHVKKIRGEYYMTTDMDISMQTAKRSAQENAKRNAMVKACGETINAWDMVESGAAGENFNSVNMVQVNGEIVEFEIVEEGHSQNPAREKEMMFYCIANVTVKKGIEPDPDFSVDIRGIKNSYMVDDQGMTFTVLSSKDAYLKVFIFENAEIGTRLYPSGLESSFPLKANQQYTFPTQKNTYYELYTDKEIETDIMVFVLTKTERPYLNEETNRQEIESWIAKIPNDQKFVFYKSINIVKN